MASFKTLLRQLFGAAKEEQDANVFVDADVSDVGTLAPLVESALPQQRLGSGSFLSGWLTDVGRVRGHNEDALYVFVGEQSASNAVLPFGLFMVSDGMGGHQAGEVASSLALRTAASYILSQVYLPMLAGSDRGADQPSLTDVVREAISQANRLVTRDVPGSGCTLTCGMILEDRLIAGHVGDSRAYLIRSDESIKQLTNDHSLVSRLKEMGQLTDEEAAVYPQRNVLYRAIGQYELEVDVFTQALQPGDRLLLCSDGLWNMIEDDEIARMIKAAYSPHAACEQLVNAANDAGGNDNITVVLTELWNNPD
jgi:protein phosphatase